MVTREAYFAPKSAMLGQGSGSFAPKSNPSLAPISSHGARPLDHEVTSAAESLPGAVPCFALIARLPSEYCTFCCQHPMLFQDAIVITS